MNAPFQPSATIEHGTALRLFIDSELLRQGRRVTHVCAEAGVSTNTVANLRHNPRRNISLPVAVALLNTIGYRLDAVPLTGEHPQPAPLTKHSKAQQRRRERQRAAEYAALRDARLEADRVMVNGLRRRLRDLRTSVQHKRHHDDLLNELDDLIFVLEKELAA